MKNLLFSALVAGVVLTAACQRTPDTTAAAPATPAAPASPAAPANDASDPELLARGEYLVRTAGCNDCHTPGYPEAQGNIPQEQWLVGSPVGFKGPWGTTYASNLRIRLADMDEAQWMDFSATLRTRPMMPDFAVRAMSADDRRALYRFIKSLGPGGQPAPAYVPPDQKPQPPYYELVLPASPAASPGAKG